SRTCSAGLVVSSAWCSDGKPIPRLPRPETMEIRSWIECPRRSGEGTRAAFLRDVVAVVRRLGSARGVGPQRLRPAVQRYLGSVGEVAVEGAGGGVDEVWGDGLRVDPAGLGVLAWAAG